MFWTNELSALGSQGASVPVPAPNPVASDDNVNNTKLIAQTKQQQQEV